MKIIQESPEHHFLTFLETVKKDNGGWRGLHLALSQKLNHADMIAKPDRIKSKLKTLRQESESLVAELKEKFSGDNTAILYQFADSDIVLMTRPADDADRNAFGALAKDLQERLGRNFCKTCNLAKDIYSYQKLADQNLRKACLIKAYENMADENRTASIPLRRERRDEPLILITEDDRFTASYAASILNKDYDIVLAKTGEEAISLYIEHAPDLVFLDIHLPGLDGLETLRALRRIDPQSCIVMLSVDTVKQNIVLSREEGATTFLKKPFGKERLLAAVAKSPYIKTPNR